MGMTIGNDMVLTFFYDQYGRPYAMNYNNQGFLWYMLNQQGDVVALIGYEGAIYATYQYDAWGNIIHQSSDNYATVNPLRYRGYVYDEETELYYCNSRYYDPQTGRFINADSLVSTGQGILGNNMFTYCLNNPVNYLDSDGHTTVAVQLWTSTMWWLCLVDLVLPVGDIIYGVGILLTGTIALSSYKDSAPVIAFDEADVAYAPTPPNDNDDDDYDDDYYNDDSNFGGRQKVGKNKGKTPRNNKKQNEQFDYAARKAGVNIDKIRPFHDFMTGRGEGLDELIAIAETFVSFLFALFCDEGE